MIRKHAKDLIVILVLAIVLTVAFTCMDIKTVNEYYSTPLEEIKGDVIYLSIDAITISKRIETNNKLETNLKPVKKGIEKYLSKEGIILHKRAYALKKGDTVFSVLQRVTSYNEIPISTRENLSGGVYVKGINNIFERDCGDLSGWVYLVNGEMPNVGMSEYFVKKDDKIEIRYTCEMGDINKNKYLEDY